MLEKVSIMVGDYLEGQLIIFFFAQIYFYFNIVELLTLSALFSLKYFGNYSR